MTNLVIIISSLSTQSMASTILWNVPSYIALGVIIRILCVCRVSRIKSMERQSEAKDALLKRLSKKKTVVREKYVCCEPSNRYHFHRSSHIQFAFCCTILKEFKYAACIQLHVTCTYGLLACWICHSSNNVEMHKSSLHLCSDFVFYHVCFPTCQYYTTCTCNIVSRTLCHSYAFNSNLLIIVITWTICSIFQWVTFS